MIQDRLTLLSTAVCTICSIINVNDYDVIMYTNCPHACTITCHVIFNI